MPNTNSASSMLNFTSFHREGQGLAATWELRWSPLNR